MDPSERVLCIRQAERGNADALHRLLVLYHNQLSAFLAAKMGDDLRRHVDVEDLLQEAYAHVFKAVGRCRFVNPAAFYKWIERIALDRLKKTRRDLKRHKRDIGRNKLSGFTGRRLGDPESTYPNLIERLTSPGTTPSGKLARRETRAAVVTSMARLTDEQRSVIRLRFLDEKSVATVAKELDKTEASVHMLTYRGLRAMKTMLGSLTRYY